MSAKLDAKGAGLALGGVSGFKDVMEKVKKRVNKGLRFSDTFTAGNRMGGVLKEAKFIGV
jgi:6-phosphogluconate dehydrogenase (decarboxylating)